MITDTENTSIPIQPDTSDAEQWVEEMVNLLMPKILRRLDAILPEYICEEVLKHIDYPMDFKQAACLLNISEGALRKCEMRGGITFTKIPRGRKVITLQQLCKQIGKGKVLRHIKNKQ